MARTTQTVHDTGSADGTPDIAAGYGAVVTNGPWTEDFAAARNAAQDGWTAEWVLAIDADERLVADRAQLFRLLAATTADVLLLETHNFHGESPYAHWAPRLYRPAQVRGHRRPPVRPGCPARAARPGGAVAAAAPRGLSALRGLSAPRRPTTPIAR
jgi:glycosyltransferase involved in cell wall biosynthesis